MNLPIGASEWTGEILQEMFRHTPVGVVLNDLHGTILDANAAFCSMIGYPRELVVGRPAATFVHPDEVGKLTAYLGQLREGEIGNKRAVHRLQARSGKTVWVNTTASVVRGRGEQICGVAFVEEISERMEMEKALRESESLYRQVIEDQTDLVVRTTSDGIRSFANRAYAKYFGLKENEIAGTPFLPLIAEEDRPVALAGIATLTPENPVRDARYRVIAADGSLRWTEWTHRATFDVDGKLSTVQSMGRDVTDRVETIEALRASEYRYRRLLSELPIAAWETDWADVIAFVRQLGLDSPQSMIERVLVDPDLVRQASERLQVVEVNAAALRFAGVDDRRAFDNWIKTAYPVTTIEALIRGIAPVMVGSAQTSRAEIQVRRANGELRDVVLQWGRSGRRNDWRVINAALDVTDRKGFEREIVRQQKNLEEAEAIAHLGHWEIDPHGGFITGSKEHWRIYDGTDGGPQQRTFAEVLECIHPDDRPRVAALIDRICEGEFASKPGGRQWRVVRPDGSVHTIRAHSVAERDVSGRIIRIHGTLQDITDQIEAAEALQRSETMYRSLFRNLPFSVWEADWSYVIQQFKEKGIRSSAQFMAGFTTELGQQLVGERRILEVNQRALELYGCADLEAFSQENWLAIEPSCREHVARAVAEILFGERLRATVEYRIVRPDGSVSEVEAVSVANPAAEGRMTTAVRDVTKHRKFERELQRSEQLYRTLFHSLPIAVWETDWTESIAEWSARGIRSSVDFLARLPDEEIGRFMNHRRILEVNEHALRLFGVTDPAMFAGQTWSSLHPRDRMRVTAVFAQVLFGESSSAGTDLQLIRNDGTLVDIEVMFSTSPAAPGRMTTAAKDVTERKKAERALQESEAQYRLLFHNMPVAAWETDWSGALEQWKKAGALTPEGAVAWLRGGDRTNEELATLRELHEVNQNAMAIAAAPDIESFRKWALRAVRIEDISRVVPEIASVILGLKKTARLEMQTQRCDGTIIDMDMLLAAQDEHPGRIISTAIDVTETKRIERELVQSQILLESAQAIAHTGSWEMHLETDELTGSKEYWNIVDGHDGGSRTRKLSDVLLHVPEGERSMVMQRITDARDAFFSGRSQELTTEFHIIRDNGSSRVVRGRGVFGRSPTGDVRGYGILQDITEQRDAEDVAQRQRDELMRADRMISLGILVSGVAHEINNPNHFIMLNAPLLRSAWNDLAPIVDDYARHHGTLRVANLPWEEMRTEIAEIIDEIAAGAERIRAIVSELRGFGRDQDRGPHKPTSVNDVVEGSLRLLMNHVRKATTNFVIKLGSELPPVAANPQRIEQVIVNLVLNSCQALQRRDAAIRVETLLDAAHDRVEIRVVDEGRGIAPDDLNKVCDPFFTTKRAEGGMGLGLAVSDRIVQEHYGTIKFQSELGRGTTAIVSLPALRDAV